MAKRIVFSVVVIAVVGVGAAALLHFSKSTPNFLKHIDYGVSNVENRATSLTWNEAVEKVKADRASAGRYVAVETPPELRHYSDRHWFLAAQVAEVERNNVRTCQDFVDLAAMIKRGDLVLVPVVTNAYVLYGIGEKADDTVFTRYEQRKSIELYTEAQLSEAYRSLHDKQSNLQGQITKLRDQSRRLTKRDRTLQREMQKQISSLELESKTADEEKERLDQFYGQPGNREQLMREYESLRTLATDFAGRSYNLDNPSDRLVLKINMLSTLRPEALKIMEEVASAYHRMFDRPLPVSSLVRPEQYQHELRKVNRNAVLIETPPHSTGLAFDIDYRYMSAAEQAFLMGELARIEKEGRIEVLRERNANYHVFAFMNGTRPGDDLIAASLEKASAPVRLTHHVTKASGPTRKIQKGKAKSRSRGSTARRRRR